MIIAGIISATLVLPVQIFILFVSAEGRYLSAVLTMLISLNEKTTQPVPIITCTWVRTKEEKKNIRHMTMTENSHQSSTAGITLCTESSFQ
jgi:hypothetical protein